MTLRLESVVVLAIAFVACGGGEQGKTVPNPVGPGEIINVTLCGSTTEPRNPCSNFPDNSIEIRVSSADGSQQCPCFNFSFLNQNLADLGAPSGNYEFTGLRPGNYTVTGQFNTRGHGFFFAHNTSTSTIGIVPASLQSLSGPVAPSATPCRIEYNTGSSLNRVATSFSFQFTVAAATSGGTC